MAGKNHQLEKGGLNDCGGFPSLKEKMKHHTLKEFRVNAFLCVFVPVSRLFSEGFSTKKNFGLPVV